MMDKVNKPIIFYQPMRQLPQGKCPVCRYVQNFYPRWADSFKRYLLTCRQCNNPYFATHGLAAVVVCSNTIKY